MVNLQHAPPEAVKVTIVKADARCNGAACSTAAFEDFVARNLSAAQLTFVAGDSKEALLLSSRVGGSEPPFALLERSIEREEEPFAQLARAGLQKNADGDYVLPLAPPELSARSVEPASP